jgi:hypothetical protein
MKRVRNSTLLKSSMPSALLRSTRCSLPSRISIAPMLLLSLTGCSGGVLEQAEARAPRMDWERSGRSLTDEASMRPRRARLGCTLIEGPAGEGASAAHDPKDHSMIAQAGNEP